MDPLLSGQKICILVASGFAEEQFSALQKTLLKTGATVKVVAPENGLTHGWHENAWGHYFPIDVAIAEAMGSDFDQLLLVGGSRGVEKLKGNLHTRRILRHFFEAGKTIIALTEAVELLALCDQARNREISAPEPKHEALKNFGAIVSQEATMLDGALLTFGSLQDNWLDAVLQHMAEARTAERKAA